MFYFSMSLIVLLNNVVEIVDDSEEENNVFMDVHSDEEIASGDLSEASDDDDEI